MDFKIGDLVVCKAGGPPKMVITALYDCNCKVKKAELKFWVDVAQDFHTINLPCAALKSYKA